MRKSYKKNDAMVQTVFASDVEKKFNPLKEYYCCFSNGNGSYLMKLETNFRSEATRYFNTVAAKENLTIDYIGVVN